MLDWLEQDLADTTRKWIIAFWHLPPYSKGSHNSDIETGLVQMRAHALPILENHGVDLVLCGHSRCYERSMLLDGHYGASTTFDPLTMAKDAGNGRESGPEATGAYQKDPGPRQGAAYVVAGNSGKISGGSLNHPVMVISKNQLGSLVLDVIGNRLDAREISVTGEVVDHFTLLKRPLETQVVPVGWRSVSSHGGTPLGLPVIDNNFIEPRQAGLRRVEIAFSGPVVVANSATAVTVSGINAAGPVNLGSLGISVNATAVGDTVVVEFSNSSGPCPLPDAVKWRFTLNPATISGTNGATLPASAANSQVITSLVGDTTGNGRCSGLDVNRIANTGPFSPLEVLHLRADLTGDGEIDTADQDAAWANRRQRTDTLRDL
jgi:hypothetical protein